MIDKTNPNDHSRRVVWYLALTYLSFVIYGSLVPLHWVAIPLEQAIERFRSIPLLHLGVDSRADWVANLLLFVPLTFLWCQVLLARHTKKVRLLGYVIIATSGTLLAGAIEFTQIFFPQRTVSLNDIYAETIGGLIGLLTCALIGNRFEQAVNALWTKENQTTRITRLLHFYLLLLFAFNVLPLDLTISPTEIYHKWRDHKVLLTPFVNLKGNFAEVLYELTTDLVIWIPPGILWNISRRTSPIRTIAYGLAASLAIEVAQLFVYTRVTDTTDIVMAIAGSLVGGQMAKQLVDRRVALSRTNPVFWHVTSAVWWLVILCAFWFPFDFKPNGFSLPDAIQAMMRAPFTTYYFGTEYHAINELLRKVGFFLPLGIFLSMGIASRNRQESKSTTTIRLIGIALTAFLVEVVQHTLLNKTADITDMILEFFGGTLGLYCTRWIMAGRYENGSAIVEEQQPPELLSPTGDRTHINRDAPQAIWKRHVITFNLLLMIVAIGTRLPFVPYNIRELNDGAFFGIFSTIGLSCAIYWFCNGHFLFLHWANREKMLLLPAWLIVHATVTWIMLRSSVPLESIHDIVGSPVLRWPWEWELLSRYIALHTAIALSVIGATIIANLSQQRVGLSCLIIWLITSLFLSWPLHWAVVAEAATDNLTELMRNGGSYLNSVSLGVGMLALFIAASHLTLILVKRTRHRQNLLITLFSSITAMTLFWLGSEQVIVKYGKVFSAWQFLLSTDRAHYASGHSLAIRYALAYLLIAVLIAALQSSWMKLSYSQDVFSQSNANRSPEL